MSKQYIQCKVHQIDTANICIDIGCQLQEKSICKKCITYGLHKDHKSISYKTFFNKIKTDLQSIQYEAQFQSRLLKKKIEQVFCDLKNQFNNQLQLLENNYLQSLENFTNQNFYKESEIINILDAIDHPEKLSIFMQNEQSQDTLQKSFQLTQSYTFPFKVQNYLQQKIAQLENECDSFIQEKLILQQQNTPLKLDEDEQDKQFDHQRFFGNIAKQMEYYDKDSNKADQYNYINKTIYFLLTLSDQDFALGNATGEIQIWNIQNLQIPCKILAEHSASVKTLIQINEEVIASGSYDNNIIIWNWKQGQKLQVISAHQNWVECLLSQDQDTIVSCSCDKSIKFWGWERGELIRSIDNAHNSGIRSIIDIKEKGYLISASNDQSIKVWRIADYSFVHKIEIREYLSCLIKLNEEFFACGGGDGKIRIIRISNWQIEHVLQAHQQNTWIWRIIMLSQQIFCSCGADKTIKLFNWREKKNLFCLQNHKDSVNSIIKLDKNAIVSCGSDGLITLWN